MDAWNNRVVSARKAEEAEIVRANLPLYADSEREFRRHFDSIRSRRCITSARAFARSPPI